MSAQAQQRAPLNRERVCQAAMGVADEGGLAAVTMRRLAEVLGVEAMSLYYHVPNKDDVLDGMVDAVAQEINAAVTPLEPGPDWRTSARRRILTARQVLLRHRWAPGLLATRNPTSMAVMQYHDGLIGLMREGGLSYDLIHHGLHALGSRALGFVQELADTGDIPSDEALAAMAGPLPNLAGMLREVAHDDPDSTLGWCDDQTEFEFGLDLILDGLDRAARTQG